jgi:putative ABC transport system permease protein
VVRRTREMGVRRAAGASAGAVCGQILLEVLVIGSSAIVIGGLLAIQIPLLSIVPQIDWAAALPALGLSALLILMLAAGAALYPALLASGREPADALRYE